MMSLAPPGIFSGISNGLKTNRDTWAYNFDRQSLESNVERTIKFYMGELHRYADTTYKEGIDSFVQIDSKRIAWTETLKKELVRGRKTRFDKSKVRWGLYRPFTRTYLYFDRMLNERVYGLPDKFPDSASQNLLICITDIAGRSPFSVMATDLIPDIHLCATTDTFQCFTFYEYDEDGTNRRENITDWALDQFRSHYKDKSITKWDIFYYTYAVLHHPEYRTRYAANLKRELPRSSVPPPNPS